ATTATSSFTVLPAAPVQTVPGAVENLEADGGNGQIDIMWDTPLSDGNSAITDYVIQYKVGSSYVPFVDGVSISTDGLITGLVNGTEYLIRVAAKNSIGQGPFGTPVSATPATVPGQPTNLAVSIQFAGTTGFVSWDAPLSNGGAQIVDYRVFYKLRTSPTWIEHGSGTFGGTTAVVSGLDGVSEYDFKVQALNSAGNGAAVSTVDVSATAGDGQVGLTWVAPLVGSPVNYVIDYREVGAASWASIDTQSTLLTNAVTGLTNGTLYEFRVAAMADGVTVQSYSSAIEAQPWGTPTAPNVSLVAGVSQTTVSWTGATGNGSAITDYIIRYRANGSNVWRTAVDGLGINSSFVVTGLVNGTVYDFQVAAVNAVGTGTFSQTVQAAPRRAPGAPTITLVTTTRTTAEVSWTDPGSNGGASISGYVVQYRERTTATWTTYAGNEFTGSSVVIRSLNPFTDHSFRVAAVNEAGTGTYSPASAEKTLGFTMTFLRNGAQRGAVPAQVPSGVLFTLPGNTGNLERNGYEFGGWLVRGTVYQAGEQVTISRNQNIFARWLRCYISYTAVDKTSGSVPPGKSGCVSRIIRANVGSLKRTGYVFGGWSINGRTYLPRETIDVRGPVVAAAVWLRYSVTYVSVNHVSKWLHIRWLDHWWRNVSTRR
ncbi:MAG: hypothetical protein EBY26_01750, partial [Microbacteriaceae bacterium]|nr:hypothetical protein [Microbacteriaceae bacterium]